MRRFGVAVSSLLTACVSSKRGSVIIGDESHGLIDNIRVNWTDLAGLHDVPNSRIAAGRLLSMADMCAAQVAHKAGLVARQRLGTSFLCCTVGVTNTEFSCPILHTDAVRMEGRAVHCGSSALGVHIRFFRRSVTTRSETPAGQSFFTMVMITPDLKAAKVVPAMRLSDPFDIAMHKKYAAVHELQKASALESQRRKGCVLTPEAVQCPVNKSKLMHVPMNVTTTVANRIFFSSYLNNNNTVFGGELMAWMERHAVHCGRLFTGRHHIYTIGMHSVAFNEPVFATDWVTLEASVIYVRNSTMEVDVKLRAERESTGATVTNCASFILINTDEIGQKVNIPCGIDLSDATQTELHLFMEAKERYKLSVRAKKTNDPTTCTETTGHSPNTEHA